VRLSIVGVVSYLVDGGLDSSDVEEFLQLSRVVAVASEGEVSDLALLRRKEDGRM